MQLLTGYAKPIVALAVSPNGQKLFSAAHGQQMIWVWDLTTGKAEEKLRGPHSRHGIGALATSPCGGWLVSVDNHTAVIGWQLPDPTPTRAWYAHGNRKAVAIHPKGRLVATPLAGSPQRSRYGFQLMDLETRKTASQRGHTAEVSALAFSTDGATLATGSADRTVRLWDVESREELRVLTHKLVPNRVTFHPDGKTLAVACAKSVLVWNVADGSLAHTLTGHDGTMTGLAYSADGKYLASAGLDGVVILRDAKTHEVAGQCHPDVGKIGALVWRPDSSGLIAGGDKLIAVCDLDDLLARGKDAGRSSRRDPVCPAVQLTGHAKKVIGLAYSADGQALVSWSIRGGEIRVWDFSRGAGQAKATLAFIPKYGDVRGVSLSADCEHLAVMTTSPTRGTLHSAKTGKHVLTVNSSPSQNDVYLGFTSGARLLMASGTKQLRLELFDAAAKRLLSSAKAKVEAREYSKYAAAGPKDQRLYVSARRAVVGWTPAKEKVETLFEQDAVVCGLAVSPDEQLLVTLGGNSALVWELPDGRQRLELKHLLGVSGAAFVPGGRLITACYDGSVRLWDLDRGKQLRELNLGMGKLYCLAAAPDGLTYAVGVEKKNRIAVLDLPE